TPPALEDCRREIEHLSVEIDILERERAVGVGHEQRLGELTEQKGAAETRLAGLEKRWAEEKRLVEAIQKLRPRLEAQVAGPDASAGQNRLRPEEESRARADLARLEGELRQLQGETPLVQPVVDRQAVAEVVSGWTGIPVGKMVLDEIKTVLSLRDK